MVTEGSPAPDFELPSGDGDTVRLSELRGRPVVLYFYPKDDTPGCTAEACEFRDAYAAVVLGVSPDNEASHARFKANHGLPFTLLADTEHEVAERYGVWVEKTMRGRTSMGSKRSTFVVDGRGTWRRRCSGSARRATPLRSSPR
ncbi:MAG: peroxiredoxin [Gaiellaceae bacterium]